MPVLLCLLANALCTSTPPKNHYELYDVRGIEQGTRLCYKDFTPVSACQSLSDIPFRMHAMYVASVPHGLSCAMFQTLDPEVVAQYR
eukprot:scaffold81031_cov23-Cyclotella_meneghiniana.AAC.1